mmetsp:Transcript_58912/g.138903  ORF Transcript_58912/g.138903 Transcript_58912/m.138903 type:complete len:250 (-) Transcript_58912:44-793(-)
MRFRTSSPQLQTVGWEQRCNCAVASPSQSTPAIATRKSLNSRHTQDREGKMQNFCRLRQAVWMVLVVVAVLPLCAADGFSATLHLRGGLSSSLYEKLGVKSNASTKEIRLAYLKLALQWHPDKNPGTREKSTARFKELQEVYEVLSNPNKRDWYDRACGKSGSSPRAPPSGASENGETDADIEAFEAKLAAMKKELASTHKEMANALTKLTAVLQKRLAAVGCNKGGARSGGSRGLEDLLRGKHRRHAE